MARAPAAKTAAPTADIRNALRLLASATWEMALATSTPSARPTVSAPRNAATGALARATLLPTLLSVWSTQTPPLLPPLPPLAPPQVALSP